MTWLSKVEVPPSRQSKVYKCIEPYAALLGAEVWHFNAQIFNFHCK